MYVTLLALHSLFRWLVLISMLYAIFRAYRGWLGHKAFTKHDNVARSAAAAIAHVQLVLGLWLYIISPVVRYFLGNLSEGMHNRQIRFFGMEHITMMLLGITVVTIGSAKARRKPTGEQKFKTMAIWFTIALLIILSSVPWQFSPLISRPYFRSF